MALHPNRLWLGSSGRGDSRQSAAAAGRGGSSALSNPVAAHALQATAGREAPGGDQALPEGYPELLARPVPLLRCGGPAADQPRPGATLWFHAAPRATLHGAQGRLPQSGAAGLRANRGRSGHPHPPLGRLRIGAAARVGLAYPPCWSRTAPLRPTLRYRFRRDPAAYLAQLEALLLKQALPP